jgi:DNA mismatch repair protein MutS
MAELSPAMRQYYDMKRQCPDSILFFRMGDFYETFGEDAKTTSRELDIVLTSRSHGERGEKIPLAGIPYHALESYLGRLVKKGYRVAICEQVEDPKLAKGIVKREVVRIVTPGTVLEQGLLSEKSNNYIAAVLRGDEGFGAAFADISTGDFFCTQVQDDTKMLAELAKFRPVEVLLHPLLYGNEGMRGLVRRTGDGMVVQAFDEKHFDRDHAYASLTGHFGTTTLEGFGCESLPLAYRASNALLEYLQDSQKRELKELDALRTYSVSGYMVLDPTTLRNLEIIKNIRDGTDKRTLLEVLDATSSPMGARLLRRWLLQPLQKAGEINDRLDAVAELSDNQIFRSDVRELLGRLRDIERLNGRVAYGLANGRDLVALKESLRIVEGLKSTLAHADPKSPLLKKVVADADHLPDIVSLIEKAITDEPPVSLREGGIIRDGYSGELDALRGAMRDGKGWMAELERTERQRTGIKSLKVGYNHVFGYYIEVSKPNLPSVPSDYIRKQTLATGERYITPELKEKEELVLNASEKSTALEFELFTGIRLKVAAESKRVQRTSSALAILDVLAGFSETAVGGNYARPEINDGDGLLIRGGRHPVVEKYVDGGFVPNDTVMDCREDQLIMLTGPNMAGKSTYMRQVALIALMAHVGSYVPVKYASIGIVDRIFTRVGAFDDLVSGQSTFMVEMVELANILNNTTPKSLILLDEIGRGTSTFDGLSIACAVVEYLHTHSKATPKTIFATHYHQLTQLSGSMKRIKNYHLAVKEDKGAITFLRKVVPGATDRSYGIHVAQLAGVPAKIVERAGRILSQLEREKITIEYGAAGSREGKGGNRPPAYTQVVLFESGGEDTEHPVVTELKKLDVSNMTPVDALVKLHELQKKSETRRSEGTGKDKDGKEDTADTESVSTGNIDN